MEVVIRSSEKVKKLAHLFHHLKNIINDVNINFTEDQMYIQGMDASHASLIEVQIKQEWFDEYKIDGIVFHDSKTCFNNSNAKFGMPQRLQKITTHEQLKNQVKSIASSNLIFTLLR